ncbi:EF-hand domain-containing protein [Salinisphaera sp. T31B1]|uniref:EF-hand domain-containing protein n=1 Tax=Salinisphaera sp. T31B1 TaxID=727963 RepID=UPI00333EF4F4
MIIRSRATTAGRRPVFRTMLGALCLVAAIPGHAQAPLGPEDTNSDGQISRAEARSAQARNFERMDNDGDGRIDFATFADRAPGVPHADADSNQTQLEAMLRPWFEDMDADDDGQLSASEYRDAADPLFDALDTNGDGQVTRDEMRAAMPRPPKPE